MTLPTPSTPTESSTSPDSEVAARLKAARDERAFSQGAVANRTKMIDPDKKGISRTAIIGYEQGTTRPGLREIRLLCEVLRISPNWLIYGTDSAAVAAQASMELLSSRPRHQLDAVLRTALALTALKGHERDALQSLVLSLAGRQLGDMRLSALVSCSPMMVDAFVAALGEFSTELWDSSPTLEELAESLSKDFRTNVGNRFRFGEEGEVLNPEASLYPDPKPEKLENSTDS